MHLVSGVWRKIGNFTYGMVDFKGSLATDGGTRSHKAGCRPAPTRPPTMFISIPLVKFDLETSLETRCKPLLPYFVLSAAPLYPESGMNCY